MGAASSDLRGTTRPMHVRVKLFSRFREYLPSEARGEAKVELHDGATVADLLDHLSIVQRVKLITINDEPQSDREQLLYDGDIVRIFPVVVGG
jgi:molybdopterin converting factor small subunit